MGEYSGHKLTEGHIEQIRNMRADKTSYADIREFFLRTYKIKIYDSEIAFIMRKQKIIRKLKYLKTPKAARKFYKLEKGELKGVLIKPISSETEFKGHILKAFEIHKKKFIDDVIRVISGNNSELMEIYKTLSQMPLLREQK